MVAEGVKTSKVVMELAHEYGVSMPIAREVHRRGARGQLGRRRVPRAARPARRARPRCTGCPTPDSMARMRLRSRLPRQPGEDWVQARGAGRWTTGRQPRLAGTRRRRSGRARGRRRPDVVARLVDRRRGPLARAAREVAVRQALLGNSPVVETRLRVPSGDAVHRVYAARGPRRRGGARRRGAQRHARCRSRVALAIRPYDLSGAGPIGAHRARRAAGARRRRAGRRCCRARRAGSRSSDARRRRQRRRVRRATRSRCGRRRCSCADGLANGAFLFPLAHTATLRVALPLAGATRGRRALEPARAPSRSPPAGRRSRASARASRCPTVGCAMPSRPAPGSCSSAGPSRPCAAALDLLGFADEAARRCSPTPGARAPGRALAALAAHWSLTRDLDVGRRRGAARRGAGAAPGPARRRRRRGASATPRCPASRRCSTRPASRGRPRTCAAIAVDGARRPRRSARPRRAARHGQPDLDVALGRRRATTSPPTPRCSRPSADCWSARSTDGLALSPGVPDAWLGQGWEVHDAPDRGRPPVLRDPLARRPAGPALGARAARRRRPGAPHACPTLDPSWSTTEPRGEALLAPVAVPERPSAAARPHHPGHHRADAARPRVSDAACPGRRARRRCSRRSACRRTRSARPRTDGILVLLAIDKLALGQELRYDIAAACEGTGLPEEELRHIWRSLGLPRPAPGEPVFSDVDLGNLAAVADLMHSGVVSPEVTYGMTRVIGSSMARVASALDRRRQRAVPSDGRPRRRARTTSAARCSSRSPARPDGFLPDVPRGARAGVAPPPPGRARRRLLRGDAEDGPGLVVGFADLVGLHGAGPAGERRGAGRGRRPVRAARLRRGGRRRRARREDDRRRGHVPRRRPASARPRSRSGWPTRRTTPPSCPTCGSGWRSAR